MINNFEELKDFLTSKNKLRMAHIYKPSMLLTILRTGGTATREEIAEGFVLNNQVCGVM